jgi:hypothetical protein
MSETSLDLCGKAKGCPPERNIVNHYTQHISIRDKHPTAVAFAQIVAGRRSGVTKL